jgi:hypothetical protein
MAVTTRAMRCDRGGSYIRRSESDSDDDAFADLETNSDSVTAV